MSESLLQVDILLVLSSRSKENNQLQYFDEGKGGGVRTLTPFMILRMTGFSLAGSVRRLMTAPATAA